MFQLLMVFFYPKMSHNNSFTQPLIVLPPISTPSGQHRGRFSVLFLLQRVSVPGRVGAPSGGVFPAWKLVVFAGKQGEIRTSRASQRTVPCAGPVVQSSQGGGRPLAAPTARAGGDGEQCSPLRAGAGGKRRASGTPPPTAEAADFVCRDGSQPSGIRHECDLPEANLTRPR